MPRLSGLAGNLPKMALLRALCWMHLMSAVIVPFFRHWGHLSYTQLFALEAWFMFANFALEVPTGAVADRFGRKASVALGAFLLAGASLLYGSVASLPVFALGELVFAVALTLISGADEALVYDSLKALGREAEATHLISRLEACKLGGVFVGALLGAVVAARFGVRSPMLLQAVPMGLSGLVALTLVEPPRGGDVQGRPRGYLRLVTGGLEHFRREPELRALALDQVACAAAAWLVIWLYQPQLERTGVPLAAFGVVHAAMGLGQVALLAHVGAVESALGGRLRLLRLMAWLPALAMLLMAATDRPAASIGLIVVAGVAGMGRPPLFSGALNARIASDQRATVLSAVSAARTLAIGIVYLAVGPLVDRSLPGGLAFVGGLGVVAALFAAAPGRLITEPPGGAPAAR